MASYIQEYTRTCNINYGRHSFLNLLLLPFVRLAVYFLIRMHSCRPTWQLLYSSQIAFNRLPKTGVFSAVFQFLRRGFGPI